MPAVAGTVALDISLTTINGESRPLEEWVTNRFGRRLFELFFKSYNEKVWGVPASEIRAEWAAQRIKGLSFFSAARAAFFGNGVDAQSSRTRAMSSRGGCGVPGARTR